MDYYQNMTDNSPTLVHSAPIRIYIKDEYREDIESNIEEKDTSIHDLVESYDIEYNEEIQQIRKAIQQLTTDVDQIKKRIVQIENSNYYCNLM